MNLQTVQYVPAQPSPLKFVLTARLTDLQAAATRECIQRVMLNAARCEKLQYLLLDTSGTPLFLSHFHYCLTESVIQTRRNTWLVLLFAQVVPWCVRHHLERNIHIVKLSDYALGFMFVQ